MKELTIEQKAKAYDELIKRLNKAREDVGGYTFKSVYDEVMSELAESEDERMIQYFKDLAPFDKADELYEKYGFSHKDAIAWLEKQGKQKPIDTKNLETAISNMLKVYSHIILHRSLTQDELNETDVYAAENTKNLLCFLEQKPWSAEDEKILSNIIKDLVHPWNEYIPDRIEEEIKWLKNKLKSLKDKCLPQPKQEWSEEDEKIRQDTIRVLEEGRDKYIRNSGCFPSWSKSISWLKSLRPQWKPNEEMLEALYRAIPKNVMEISEDEMLLDKLYQGLKYGRVLSEK